MSAHGADPQKTVKAALLANAGIALAKAVAAIISGSVAMMAEAVHSFADTANQGLLLLGMRLSAKKPTALHPFGRYSEIYFWAFIVSLLLFFVGGVFAIYEGSHKLLHPEAHNGSLIVPLLVLGVSIALELGSFIVAFKEFNKSRGARSFGQALFSSKDPTIPLILLEDTGAVIGLIIAALSIATSAVTGSTAADGVGSVLIGVLLCTIGLLLAKDTRSLLIGEGIDAETKQRVEEVTRGTPGIERVNQILGLHLGPEAVLLALKVAFVPGSSLADVERIIDDAEVRLREALPKLKSIFIEPDSDYDAAKDPNFAA